MEISPDAFVYWRYGWFELNATIVFTWGTMLLLVIASILVTRNLSSGYRISRWQNLLESIVSGMMQQIREVTRQRAGRFLPFLGTLFLFILISNLLSVVPGYRAPTGSLSTTAALAICVFIAVPLFGIAEQGVGGYLKNYIKPTPIMLPFNVMSEISRTLALAVRLFGNIMSAAMIAGILLAVAPFIFPVLMNLLGLLTGVVQAYIFAILAAVYIASGMRAHEQTAKKAEQKE
ncbi:MAG: F0F1 ATP synthase subunit A [Desulfovibrionales bacterium]